MDKYEVYKTLNKATFVLNEQKLIDNLKLIRSVKDRAGVDIILALKGFAMWKFFPLIKEYLNGATASSLNEARLIYEEMGVHASSYFPVYLDREFEDVLKYSNHLIFNSLGQFNHFYPRVKSYDRSITCGIRVNPEFSKVEVDLYNPTAPGSRLGMSYEHLGDSLPIGVEGIHFHALCESSSYDLEETLVYFEKYFGKYLSQIKWVNMGGGHLMTRKGYDIDHLVHVLSKFKNKYDVKVILEPGSAIAWDTGDLVANIIDIIDNHGIITLMTDVSFTAHMPDTLEMPYRPRIEQTNESGPFKCRIGGTSCLSGDFMYEYGFDSMPEIGDKIIFNDMIHYTIVKTTMFNGIDHPDIAMIDRNGNLKLLRQFTYDDYKYRMD